MQVPATPKAVKANRRKRTAARQEPTHYPPCAAMMESATKAIIEGYWVQETGIPPCCYAMIEAMADPLLDKEGRRRDQVAQYIADRLGPAIDAVLDELCRERASRPKAIPPLPESCFTGSLRGMPGHKSYYPAFNKTA